MREHWLRVHKFLKDEEKRIRGEIYLKRNKPVKFYNCNKSIHLNEVLYSLSDA
ncbi:hypothetical protein YC2023_007063 [Brassica napus]